MTPALEFHWLRWDYKTGRSGVEQSTRRKREGKKEKRRREFLFVKAYAIRYALYAPDTKSTQWVRWAFPLCIDK